MKISRIQIIAHLISALPGIVLIVLILTGSLSANPIQTATVITGRSAVILILASLFGTPLKNIFKMSVFLWLRKIFGLWGFYYSLAHFLIFAGVDYQFNWNWLQPELAGKPFLQIGLAALFLLLILAVTSINSIKTRMGTTWKKLHKLAYFIPVVIIIHMIIASKGDLFDSTIFSLVFAFAILLRLPPLRKLSVPNLPKWARVVNTFLIKNINA
jgi:sulfoxide reductase heme-binding subunit YedZ